MEGLPGWGGVVRVSQGQHRGRALDSGQSGRANGSSALHVGQRPGRPCLPEGQALGGAGRPVAEGCCLGSKSWIPAPDD